MRRWRRRRGPRRGSAQCLGAEGGGWRAVSRKARKEPPAPSSCCSFSGPESPPPPPLPPPPPPMARRRRSPGRFFSPTRALGEAYSSEPEAAGGEGGLGPSRARDLEEEEEEDLGEEEAGRGGSLPGRKGGGKSRASLPPRRRPPAKASPPPRRLAAWQPHLAPAGEGCPTPGTTSCTTLYGGDFQGQPASRSPPGRSGSRLEDLLLLREEPWATPVGPRAPLDYGAEFPTDASKPPSLCPSSFSFSQLDHRAKMAAAAPEERRKKKKKMMEQLSSRRDWQELCESSPSLADLMHSLRQYEEEEAPYVGPDSGAHHHHNHHHHPHHPPHKPRKGEPHIGLQDLADKRYEELLPERDKKIAALMLARHQEEEEMKDRQLEVSEAWEKMRQKEKKQKARLEKERQYQLADSLDQWQRDRDRRKSRLKLEEQQLIASREREMMLRDKKWKKLAKEQECRRREKSENARLQAEYRKHCQEKQLWEKRLSERNTQEHNSYAYKEKMLQALEKRLMKEMERKKRKTDMNEYRRSRHIQAKEQVDDRLKADELYKRLCIEQKLQRSQEILEQLLEERNRELKEKTFKEEEQGMIAKVRAKETEEEKRRRKEMLLQIAEMKIQQAREIMSKNIEDRAQRMKEINCMKERNHHCRKQKLDYDEKCNLQELQEALRRKDQKSNQILRQKDAAIEESRKLAKASYDLRQKVRDLINHNSFDQMALDAHRNASLLRGL